MNRIWDLWESVPCLGRNLELTKLLGFSISPRELSDKGLGTPNIKLMKKGSKFVKLTNQVKLALGEDI